MDNFADHPQSIAELRSDKTQCAADWTPRDALIYLLREIDAGRLEINSMVCVYETKGALDHVKSTPNILEAVGLLELAKDQVIHRVRPS